MPMYCGSMGGPLHSPGSASITIVSLGTANVKRNVGSRPGRGPKCMAGLKRSSGGRPGGGGGAPSGRR